VSLRGAMLLLIWLGIGVLRYPLCLNPIKEMGMRVCFWEEPFLIWIKRNVALEGL
jgi:hypothetical protein